MSLLTNLRAAYNLDQSSGNATDSSGNGNTLTNTGTVTYGAGLIGNCAQFGASNTSKELSSGNNLGIGSTDDFTVAYWWRNTAVNTLCGVVSIVYGTGTKFMWVGYDGANSRYLLQTQTGNLIATIAQSANVFNNVVAVNSGGTVTLYVNNANQGTIALSSTTGLSDNFELGHKTPGGGQFWNGDEDIVNVWNRALNTTEITQLYNSGSGLQYPFGVSGNPAFLLNMI